jgi:hypothetical protein
LEEGDDLIKRVLGSRPFHAFAHSSPEGLEQQLTKQIEGQPEHKRYFQQIRDWLTFFTGHVCSLAKFIMDNQWQWPTSLGALRQLAEEYCNERELSDTIRRRMERLFPYLDLASPLPTNIRSRRPNDSAQGINHPRTTGGLHPNPQPNNGPEHYGKGDIRGRFNAWLSSGPDHHPVITKFTIYSRETLIPGHGFQWEIWQGDHLIQRNDPQRPPPNWPQNRRFRLTRAIRDFDCSRPITLKVRQGGREFCWEFWWSKVPTLFRSFSSEFPKRLAKKKSHPCSWDDSLILFPATGIGGRSHLEMDPNGRATLTPTSQPGLHRISLAGNDRASGLTLSIKKTGGKCLWKLSLPKVIPLPCLSISSSGTLGTWEHPVTGRWLACGRIFPDLSVSVNEMQAGDDPEYWKRITVLEVVHSKKDDEEVLAEFPLTDSLEPRDQGTRLECNLPGNLIQEVLDQNDLIEAKILLRVRLGENASTSKRVFLTGLGPRVDQGCHAEISTGKVRFVSSFGQPDGTRQLEQTLSPIPPNITPNAREFMHRQKVDFCEGSLSLDRFPFRLTGFQVVGAMDQPATQDLLGFMVLSQGSFGADRPSVKVANGPNDSAELRLGAAENLLGEPIRLQPFNGFRQIRELDQGIVNQILDLGRTGSLELQYRMRDQSWSQVARYSTAPVLLFPCDIDPGLPETHVHLNLLIWFHSNPSGSILVRCIRPDGLDFCLPTITIIPPVGGQGRLMHHPSTLRVDTPTSGKYSLGIYWAGLAEGNNQLISEVNFQVSNYSIWQNRIHEHLENNAILQVFSSLSRPIRKLLLLRLETNSAINPNEILRDLFAQGPAIWPLAAMQNLGGPNMAGPMALLRLATMIIQGQGYPNNRLRGNPEHYGLCPNTPYRGSLTVALAAFIGKLYQIQCEKKEIHLLEHIISWIDFLDGQVGMIQSTAIHCLSGPAAVFNVSPEMDLVRQITAMIRAGITP